MILHGYYAKPLVTSNKSKAQNYPQEAENYTEKNKLVIYEFDYVRLVFN